MTTKPIPILSEDQIKKLVLDTIRENLKVSVKLDDAIALGGPQCIRLNVELKIGDDGFFSCRDYIYVK